MKVSYAQINSTVGDIAQNKDRVISAVTCAIEQGADLVVFSEFAISGSPTYDLVYTKDFSERCYLALSDIATYSHEIPIIIGTPTTNQDENFSSAVVLERGEIKAIFNKAMVTSRDESDYYSGIDSEFFSDDDNQSDSIGDNIVEIKGRKVLISIGEDIEFVEYVESLQNRYNKPEMVINITNTPYSHGIIKERDQLYGQIAKKIALPLLVVNSAGANSDTIFYGSSSLYGVDGGVVSSLKPFDEDVKSVDITPKVKGSDREYSPRVEYCYNAITTGLRDYLQKSGIKSICLGLSGGIDSAVVTAIATDVLGKDNVRVVLMPSQFSSDHSVNDAEQLAQKLGIKYETIAIEPIYQSYMSALDSTFAGTKFSLAEENLQARIRGMIVMAISNKFGNMLLNTSNKSEAAMGYGTLYGDTNGGLSILGDLYKWEVYALAKYINRDEEIIPQHTITKAPSAELRENQKDSDSLPEYEILDKILFMLIELAKSPADIIASGMESETVHFVASRLRANEFKRYQLPPVLRLSKCTLGKGRVMPLVGKY